MILRVLLFVLAGLVQESWGQRGCSRDRMRQCDDSLMRSIQRRVNDMSRTDMASHCVGVRDDFNCLLRETRCLTSETDRNRNGDTIRNALKYIRDGCDSAGTTWRDSSCFMGDNMKTCESSYPLAGAQYASHNPETCRKFNLFSDCVSDTVRSRCRPEDERMLGQYLVDSAQDLAWNCGESTSTSDWDRDTDRYRSGNDRTGNDRLGSDRLGSDRLGSDRVGSDRYGDRERDRYNDRGGYDDRNRNADRDRYGGSYNRNNGYGSSDITCCRNEQCDRSRMQQCRDSLYRAIEAGTGGYQDTSKCRKTRDDFNCLMYQTSNCVGREDRDRNNDLFKRAKDFISRNCDTYGRWTENSCYKTTEINRCEALLSNTRGGANYEACRSYLSFRDCVISELQRRCTREDDLFQGTYLADKAQELSWQCGNDRGAVSDRRDPSDRNYDRTYDRYDNNRQDNYNNLPTHLEDEDEMCLARIKDYADQCRIKYDERKRSLYTENDYDARNKINCCAVRNYRNCLTDITRRYCQSERYRVVDTFLAGMKHTLETDTCARIYEYECSAAGSPSQLHLALLLATLLFTFAMRR